MPISSWFRVTSAGCAWVRPKLTGLLLGELPEWQVRLTAGHVGKCRACAHELAALQETVAGVLTSGAEAARREELPPLTAEAQARVRALVRGARVRPARVLWALSGAAALVLSAVALRPRILPAPVLGRVVWASGRPEYYVWGRGWRLLPAEAAVTEGARVRTGEVDRVEVQFSDGSRARMDFGTEARFGTRPAAEAGVRRADLELEHGRVWLLVTHDQVGLRVRTQVGIAEALGTIFEVDAHLATSGKGPQPETKVTVLRGKVRVSNQHGYVDAEEGTTTHAHADAAPPPARKVANLESLRRELPWSGGPQYEVWVIPPLDEGEAARRMAGRRGWLGMEVARAALTLQGGPSPGAGLTVARVMRNSPAARGGVVAGDRLVSVGGLLIQQQGDLWRAELLSAPGARVEVRLLRGRKTERLRMTCAEFPERRPARSNVRLEEANRSFVRGAAEKAEARYEELAREGQPAALHNLGVLAEMGGRPAEAQDYYRQAAQREGESARLHYSLAIAFARLGNLRSAIQHLKRTLAADPDFPGAGFMAGRMEGFLGNYAAGRRYVQQLQANPMTRAQGLCLAGELLRLQRDFARALGPYQEAAAADPLYPDPPTYLGATYFTLGHLREARAWSERALRIDPGSVRALTRLGLITSHEGDDRRALKYFVEAQRRHPEYSVVYNNLGRSYYRLHRYTDAESSFRQAIALDPDRAEPHTNRGMALARLGDFAAARGEYHTAMNLDPTYKEAYTYLAELHRRLHQPRLAQAVEQAARDFGL